jgi:hypothetical protein
MLARTKQKDCKENNGSQVAQLNVDMNENEGSKSQHLTGNSVCNSHKYAYYMNTNILIFSEYV